MDNQNNNRNPMLVSPMTLRKAIGVIAILLPVVMLTGTITIGGCTQVQRTISHYYFTVMGDVFVVMLCASAVLFLCYKGYDLKDNIICSITGILIICIALFPTSKNNDCECVIRTLSEVPMRIKIHFFSAGLFYISVACISLFLFTKSSGNRTRQKIARNRVYRLCGIMILVSILFIYLVDSTNVFGAGIAKYNPVFWLECVAQFFYGLSWLVKGGLLLKDKETLV